MIHIIKQDVKKKVAKKQSKLKNVAKKQYEFEYSRFHYLYHGIRLNEDCSITSNMHQRQEYHLDHLSEMMCSGQFIEMLNSVKDITVVFTLDAKTTLRHMVESGKSKRSTSYINKVIHGRREIATVGSTLFTGIYSFARASILYMGNIPPRQYGIIFNRWKNKINQLKDKKINFAIHYDDHPSYNQGRLRHYLLEAFGSYRNIVIGYQCGDYSYGTKPSQYFLDLANCQQSVEELSKEMYESRADDIDHNHPIQEDLEARAPELIEEYKAKHKKLSKNEPEIGWAIKNRIVMCYVKYLNGKFILKTFFTPKWSRIIRIKNLLKAYRYRTYIEPKKNAQANKVRIANILSGLISSSTEKVHKTLTKIYDITSFQRQKLTEREKKYFFANIH
ncbi:hypothetical protein pCXcHR2015_22 [Xenohaliotis phage pCXc-HR2015]|nr:hypothetical protein pCXcHR2015_22 [Xenohaliotis phage pCXc-HR2015]